MDDTQSLHVGFDDTDSKTRGCTTYIAALLVEKLEKLKVNFLDYPNLIRLNPNVPWKTRGNGALCLRFSCAESLIERIKSIVIETVKEHSDLSCKDTAPGIVFYKGAKIPQTLKIFAKNTITGIQTLDKTRKLLEDFKCDAVSFNSHRGLIGALAAIGEILESDHTFEIIAYRKPEYCGSKRKVNETSIFQMDQLTKPYTYNNVDSEKKRVIITPRGPDPILFGIRGETPEIVKRAFEYVEALEPIERWVIFRTNQGTDAHLKPITSLSLLEPYSSIIAKGIVSGKPQIIPLRHTIFQIHDEDSEVDCAAYEPTGSLRKIARELIEGDCLEVYGAVRKNPKRKGLTINLEKIDVLKLAPDILYRNPKCSKCGATLKSMGKNKGFRCDKCKTIFRYAQKIETKIERNLRSGLYLTSSRSQRHLTKPLKRYGQEKNRIAIELIENWHFP